MIDWKDHEAWLLEKLGRFQEWKRVAFAASCAGRALPVYIAHVEHLDERRRAGTEVEQVKFALEFIWTNLVDRNAGGVEDYTKVLERVITEKEAESAPPLLLPLDSEALYAAYAIIYSLQTYANSSPEDAVGAANSNYNILHCYFNETRLDSRGERSAAYIQDGGVQSIESMLARQHEDILQFRTHPLVQAELGRQKRDIMNLDASDAVASDAFIRSFREASTNIAVLPSDVLTQT